jgi:hypothetical protein
MEECRMAWSLARDAEDFARLILQTVERLSQDGGWVPAGQALEQTLAEHPDHAYVGKLRAKPTRRIGLSAAARPTSARRTALTKASPKSPWRRRMLRRPAVAPAGQVASWSPRLFWARFSAVIAALARTRR